jgi:hypothetical protein
VLDFDLEALSGLESGVLEPTAGDFEPWESGGSARLSFQGR